MKYYRHCYKKHVAFTKIVKFPTPFRDLESWEQLIFLSSLYIMNTVFDWAALEELLQVTQVTFKAPMNLLIVKLLKQLHYD